MGGLGRGRKERKKKRQQNQLIVQHKRVEEMKKRLNEWLKYNKQKCYVPAERLINAAAA